MQFLVTASLLALASAAPAVQTEKWCLGFFETKKGGATGNQAGVQDLLYVNGSKAQNGNFYVGMSLDGVLNEGRMTCADLNITAEKPYYICAYKGSKPNTATFEITSMYQRASGVNVPLTKSKEGLPGFKTCIDVKKVNSPSI